VHTPTLVVAGLEDRVVPPVAGLALARGLPRARFHSLPGRHLVWCGRSAPVGDVVGDWLQRMSLSRADVRFT
jgi:pimeloyl-ACP methyl ester carboxylesterase